MLTWLLVIILAYFFFSMGSLGDKIILSGSPKPASYTFFVGILSAFVVLIIPFTGVKFLSGALLVFGALAAISYVIGLYAMFCAVEKFDVSKVMTTIGATQPIFIFILSWIFWGAEIMSKINILAFILLLAGSVLISFQKSQKATGKYFQITIFASLMFSLNFIFQKNVFLGASFWQGIVCTGMFTFLFSLFFLFRNKFREEIFEKKGILSKKNGTIFICSQTSGSLASMLQSFAIYLSPVAFLPVLNSLRGLQYVFLFLIVLFFSVFFPRILKEEISRKVIFQKIISITLIAIGLALLVL
jgi:drug/metabolite transporter (DMT)-like permease